MKNADILIVGSGIAGLSFAIKIAKARPDLSICLLTKKTPEKSNTAQAQGGIAVVMDKLKDSFEQHIQDTLTAGRGLCRKNVVEMVVKQAPERLEELIGWGTSFDTEKNGALSLGLEGGHSQNRIVHQQDFTGLEIEQKLLKKAHTCPNIQFHEHYFVCDLVVNKHNTCTGVKVMNRKTKTLHFINSKIIMLATGGSGRIFGNTTNPTVATGDGVAMAYRKGAKIEKMNYFQFHPTALYQKDKQPLFLISEAVRGFGAHIVNGQGSRFLFKYDCRGELATRDIVSEAIFYEMETSGGPCVYLDCRHLDFLEFKKRFPTIVAYCNSIGIHVHRDLIPIVPAAHYQCGGVSVNIYAQTSIQNLYASGECAYTGLHGANRLASNSLLEALVFSHQAAHKVLQDVDNISSSEVKELQPNLKKKDILGFSILKELEVQLQGFMRYNAIFSAEKEKLQQLLEQLDFQLQKIHSLEKDFLTTPEFLELKNMLQVAILIVEQAKNLQIDHKMEKKAAILV